jgi:hypothetical protein
MSLGDDSGVARRALENAFIEGPSQARGSQFDLVLGERLPPPK